MLTFNSFVLLNDDEKNRNLSVADAELSNALFDASFEKTDLNETNANETDLNETNFDEIYLRREMTI